MDLENISFSMIFQGTQITGKGQLLKSLNYDSNRLGTIPYVQHDFGDYLFSDCQKILREG